jgi:signal transduction histidine kinase
VHESLVPVERVRRTIASIAPDDLSQRAAVPTGLAETTEIAMALNHLLTRVEGAQRALTAFTADASHELRTPLTFLRAQAQWALDGARSEESLRDALISVHAEAERMHRLVEGLLLLARGDNRDLAVERERFEVASIVAEVSEVGSSLIREPAVTVSSEVATETVALGDAGHTRQVLLNLVVNAARYTTAGSIRIRAARENELVRLSVEDTGCGIAASDVPRIFERFGRADTSRSREFGGAGLGLAIAKMLAELQGGSLEVESVPGEGSTFSLLLPAAGAVAAS